MTEATITGQTDVSAQGTSPGAQAAAAAPPPNFDHTNIKSNFTQSPSTYWALMLPLLNGRYIVEAANDAVSPVRKFYRQLRGETEGTVSKAMSAEFKDTAWAGLVGAGMVGVTSYYTYNTYGDMKRQFKEAVGWEMNKDPEKVGFIDMLKSNNALVHDAAKNLASRTAKRFAAHLPFFAFTVPSPFRENGKKVSIDAWIKGANPIVVDGVRYTKLLSPKSSVIAGVGADAIYLATDSFGRKRTPYEELQRMTDVKINHKDTFGQIIIAQDIVNFYGREARRSGMKLPEMNTQEWQNFEHGVVERVVDLMNQTYKNTPKKEHADLTIPKLIYLMGMGLIKSDEPEKTSAYIEVANRYGIPAVKKVASDVQSGIALEMALAPYPEAVQPIRQDVAAGIVSEVATAAAQKSFVNESLKRVRPEAPLGSHAERAARAPDASPGISI